MLHYEMNGKRLLAATVAVIKINQAGEADADNRANIVLSESPMQAERIDRPGDCGWINDVSIARVSYGYDRKLRHHLTDDASSQRFEPGEHVQVYVNQEVRSQNASILLGGRLIEVLGKSVFSELQVVGANYWPHSECIEFGALEYLPEADSLLPRLRSAIEQAFQTNLPITSIPRKQSEFFQVHIGDYAPFVCSGLYPATVRSIERLEILQIAPKRGRLHIRYRAICKRP